MIAARVGILIPSVEFNKVMPAKRIRLNLILDYPVRWSKYKVLRDLIQNFFDSVPRDEWTARFRHCLAGQQLTLTATDVGFSYEWLLPIGASTKRNGEGEYAGYFGEGFKIAALCAVRDHGWDIQVRSRDWHLRVVTDELNVDEHGLRALAYDISQLQTGTSDTVLTISQFDDVDTLNIALLSFFYPGNPLLGDLIWSGPSAAVYFRSPHPKPRGFPTTERASGPGIVFAGFQALGSLPHPLVFCLHAHRGSDRERNNFFLMDVIEVVGHIAALMSPEAAAAVLRVLECRWYERPRKRYDFDSWYPIIRTLVQKVAACPEASAQWRAAYPRLLVAERVRRSDLPRYNRRRQALAWWRADGRRYRLVQDAFRQLGYSELEQVCGEHDGFTVTRRPTPHEIRRLELLETAAGLLLSDLLELVPLPPCAIIDNRRAVWQGMTTCIPCAHPVVHWHGLRVRYRLPYVALKAGLLADGLFGDAMSTYLHELAHVFGGECSAAFSHALSELLGLACRKSSALTDLQQRWDSTVES
jgi:hypothetical protein